MTNDVKGNKKGFCRCIGSKRNATENAGLLVNGVGNLVTKEKDEVLNVIFTLFFLMAKICPKDYQARETNGRVLSFRDFTFPKGRLS